MAEVITRETLKLSDEQKETLIQMETDIQWLKHELERAKRAGIADAEMEAKIEELIKLRTGLLREYS